MKLIPTMDRVLIAPQTTEAKSSGGIILPVHEDTKHGIGEILAVGYGRLADGNYVSLHESLQVGRKVLYRRQGGDEFRHDGVNYHAVWERDIVAVLSE